MQPIRIDQLRQNGGTQTRAELSEETITEYAEAMLAGASFPPIAVFNDGSAYWLADGFHRVAAAERAGLPLFQAEIRQGTRRDAILYSVGANTSHGLRRTNEDKRRAVLALLGDEEWSKWSNREIARRCAVDEKTVRSLRDDLSAELPQIGERLVERNGSTYTMNTSNLGRPMAPPPAADQEQADYDDFYTPILPPKRKEESELPPAPTYVEQMDEPVATWKERRDERMRAREERHRELATKNRELDMGDRRYSVIYGDPAWKYDNDGVNGAAEDHYPTMTTDEICGLPVRRCAEENSVLLLWATNALLEDAMRVIASWGFEYKTSFVWVKEGGRVGTGWYNRQDHELLLVAVRGEGMTAANRFSSVIRAPKGEHSRKPEVVYEMIAEMYPGAPCLELFRRGAPHPGWDAWGNQAEIEATA